MNTHSEPRRWTLRVFPQRFDTATVQGPFLGASSVAVREDKATSADVEAVVRALMDRDLDGAIHVRARAICAHIFKEGEERG